MKSVSTYDEDKRLDALVACALDQEIPTDPVLDRFVGTVATALNVPIVLISILQEDRQLFAARVGSKLEQTPRDISFCRHAVAAEAPLVVEDTHEDPRFINNPLVVGPPHIRFYTGVPLFSPQGPAIGTLCIIGDEPRALREVELSLLQNFARMVEEHIDLKCQADSMLLTDQHKAIGAAIHDLKGPLTAIKGIAELLQDAPELASSEPEMLHDMKHSVSRLQYQLFDLLDTLTSDSPAKLSTGSVHLDSLLSRVTSELSYRAQLSHKTIVFRSELDNACVDGNEPLLARCLYNLIDNALKHSPRGGTVTVTGRTDGFGASIEVADEGTGVSPHLRDTLFEPTVCSPSNGEGSVGLGLTSARLAALRHSGTLRLLDREGGATFELRLPLMFGASRSACGLHA